ncbi:hypothetical protein [Dehalobacterium formicoaceticum]|uniref:Uncharacterized protein n=1 Tax=Dehalobacterium formicoaceticum TaxID=51515 RepID=A0ABT1Y9Y1_9FIRM|nr:hypothetical protein [Dehalobacterium formicoaceticum]MCR6546910.1 hypothetical protein [Dehalobacterium formicoaceticum]
MLNCENCGKEVEQEEMLYELHGKKVCESCAMEGSVLNSPSKPCGPTS